MSEKDKGWICPSCGRGVAPDQKTCDHGGLGAMPVTLPVLPVLPIPNTAEPFGAPRYGGCDACRLSGVCMCVRPDRGPWLGGIA